ncbi:MAG: BatD family protein [Myxococcota bacterium]
MTRVCFIGCFAASLLATPAVAQVQLSATLQVDRTQLQTGEVVRLVARGQVDGASMDDFQLPDFDGFVVRSRSVQRPVQIQFGYGNQRMVQSSTTVHTYLLEAQRPGSFTLGPLTIKGGGQEAQSNTVQVQVGGAAVVGAAPAVAASAPADPDGDGYEYNDRAFLRTVVSDTEPYVGQKTEVQVLLYIAERGGDISLVQDVEAEGFWIEDLHTPGSRPPVRRQRIRGRSFQVHEIRRLALYPLRAGELTVGAAQVSIGPSRGLASLFGGGGGGPAFQPAGVPVTVTSRALPEPAPSPVIIGEGTLTASLDRTQVRTGDAITVSAVAAGSGRLSELRLTLTAQTGLRILEPQVTDGPDGRSRTFEWIVVAEAPGTYELEGLRFHTFDPVSARYTAVNAPALRFEAAGNAQTPTPVQPSTPSPSAERERPAELSLEGLRGSSELRREHRALSSTLPFWGGAAAPPLLFLLLVFGRRLREREPSAAAQSRSQRKQRLQAALSAKQAGDARTFYAALDAALLEALDAPLGERSAGMTKNELRDALKACAMADADVDALLAEREANDFARFSSAGAGANEMDAALERTRALLSKVDKLEARP